MEEINYEKDVRIDELALDIEWLEQSTLMLRFAKNEARLEREMDEAEEALELYKAELDSKIREDPEKYKLEKITEGAIKAITLQDKTYKDLSKEYLDSKFEYKVAKGAVKALENKKDALENLVKLNGQSYFAGPVVPHDIKYERDARAKQIDVNVSDKLNKSKRTKFK
jgi:hypothetical protein